MFCAYTEVMAQDDTELLLLIKLCLIFSFYICLRMTGPNYIFIRCRLYSIQKVIHISTCSRVGSNNCLWRGDNSLLEKFFFVE